MAGLGNGCAQVSEYVMVQTDPIGFCVLHIVTPLWLLRSSFLVLIWRKQRFGEYLPRMHNLTLLSFVHLKHPNLTQAYVLDSKIKADLKTTFSLTKHLHRNKVCLKCITSLEPEDLG